jgi:hypothetical protein
MTDHQGLAWMLWFTFITGLFVSGFWSWILVLQLRETRKEVQRLFTATAGMVHQETERVLRAVERPR